MGGIVGYAAISGTAFTAAVEYRFAVTKERLHLNLKHYIMPEPVSNETGSAFLTNGENRIK
ncbi:hypothetical protein [Acetanaerobacterium elongatum]|uniref:hypothetical protein n=1 Tax=Acetanaerobacterium elongatum TaxID=258515 RepID=UPI00115FBCD6|nr:hypothetical protein [Acetanaerobacterium elongatum]